MQPKIIPGVDVRNKKPQEILDEKFKPKEILEITNINALPNELLSAISPFSRAMENLIEAYVISSLEVITAVPGVNQGLIKQGNKIRMLLKKLGDSHVGTNTNRRQQSFSGMRNNSTIKQYPKRASMGGDIEGRIGQEGR